jgi:hypothetical protein
MTMSAVILPDTPNDGNNDAEHPCPEEQQHTQVKRKFPIAHDSLSLSRRSSRGESLLKRYTIDQRSVRNKRHTSLNVLYSEVVEFT